MSGHSKWANIKHRKGKQDAARSGQFTRLVNAIIVAARTKKGLDIAIGQAKKANLPKDKIDNAIARGEGRIEGAQVEELLYEAYGPDGVAILIKVLTDNKNRALSNIRAILNKFNGKLANAGAVSYLFDQKGVITISLANQAVNKDDLEMIIIESGAEDFEEDTDLVFVYTKPNKLEEVKKAIEFKAVKIESAKIEMVPKTTAEIHEEKKQSLINLLEKLEEEEDIDEVYTNANL